jgi:hypothetical protein
MIFAVEWKRNILFRWRQQLGRQRKSRWCSFEKKNGTVAKFVKM